MSGRYGPVGSNLELGTFFLQQNIEGITDRQAVGGEFRYSGPRRNLWGMMEYDTSFAEIGSVFVQGSWRLPSKFAVSGLVDRRRSPFLSTGSALVGQPVADFAELMLLYSEEELRQLALDRSAASTTVTLGISGPLSPRFQINLNATETMLDSTVESGGVAAIPATSYRYLSSDLVASGLVKQGDVSILGVRYTDSDSTRVWSLNLDTRYPLTRALRVNPRLRVDYRRIKSDSSNEWILSPGLRMQYRWGRRVRVDFEAGKRYASRALTDTDIDRESYFVTMGYQVIY